MQPPAIPAWWHFVIGLAMLAWAAFADAEKPFGKSWSIFYLAPIVYGTWFLRGTLEIVLYALVIPTVFAVPILTGSGLTWAGKASSTVPSAPWWPWS